MIALNQFNQLDNAEAIAVLEPCVAIPAWVNTVAQARPYPDLATLRVKAYEAMRDWGEQQLEQALSAHPRIGEKPAGEQAHAALSRSEQAAVNDSDDALARALKEGNSRYEARFGRVFLIRAKGRSGEEILHALLRRLNNSDAEEVQVALTQLREITLLRLEGAIGA